MNRALFAVLLLGLSVSAVVVATETTDFNRYQAIIDRTPFGAVQGTNNETAPNWLARWQYVGNTVSNSGSGPVQAILFDKEANRSYFRAEGESVDANISVVKIDINQKPPKLVLKNGLETATLTFPERIAVAGMPSPTTANPAPGTPGAAAPPTIRRIPFRRGN